MPTYKSKRAGSMTISYKWISEYIPIEIEPEQISKILTSIGLEVESMDAYESIKGGLQGLVIGEVKECVQHPGADKLKLTKVDVGEAQLLNIVCGAPNVAVGQKVVVARAGTTIHPLKGDPVTMKKTKIRGEESEGMICAEDEIGLGESHDGIIILPEDAKTGAEVADLFKPYNDWIYEIGLTPNRMDAMSHLGVARDVCAYLSHHQNTDVQVKSPQLSPLNKSSDDLTFEVEIENTSACRRYTGISIKDIEVKKSPAWLQEKLKAIGVKSINNIVDITNFILHDTGQPLHAFDADKVSGKKIIVKNLPDGTIFKTLDDKERKLSNEDLMICDGNEKGLCIAGVYGGAESGVTNSTKNIFLESAWFNPVDIRKTSFRHGLRTDAATRFEKNVDISNTLDVLKRAAGMIIDLAGGTLASAPVDIYPGQEKKAVVKLGFQFLRKLSGKNYESKTVARILQGLGFEILKQDEDEISLAVPFSKPDVRLQADVVEEIMRIDGYDNIAIPSSIMITPSVGAANPAHVRKEKVADMLTGAGFSEIFTNSITNAAYFEEAELAHGVRLLNNLSAVHNIMRPSMLETGLESVAYNLNRKNNDLRFFEFGRTYHSGSESRYSEQEHLCMYVSGKNVVGSWKKKPENADLYYIKGIAESVLKSCGIGVAGWKEESNGKLRNGISFREGNHVIAEVGAVSKQELKRFDIRQDVFFVDIRWDLLLEKIAKTSIHYHPLPQQLPVYRDLAMVLSRKVTYGEVESAVKKMRLGKLKEMQLFDVFESDKLGVDKKSFAVTFTFLDEEKTLTDKEIDSMMMKIMRTLEQDLSAEIRKGAENTTA